MVGEIRRLKFSDGVATGAPTQNYLEAITYVTFADDAGYLSGIGTPAEGDVYYNTTLDHVRTYDGTDWHTSLSGDQVQDVTNKTIDADNNTISNLEHGSEVDNPAIAHGTTTAIVGVDDTQTLTNKTVDAASNTLSNINTTHLEAGVLDTDLSDVSASDDTLASAKAIKAYADSTSSGDVAAHAALTATHGIATEIVGTGDIQTLSQKTIDADNNAISNINTTHLSTGVLDTDLTDVSASDDTLASAKAVKTYVDDTISSDVATHAALTATHGTTGDIVGTTDTQALTNKDIDGVTATDTSRITLPKAGTVDLNALTDKEATIAYDTDKSTLVVNDGSAWNEISGGGDGQGGINYITNYNAEDGLTDWSVVGTIPFSQETTSPLFGTASFKISSAGADYSGNSIKVATQTIDPAMKNNVLSGSVWVRNEDLASDDMGMKVYDVTNAAYVSMLQGSTIGASSAGDFSHPFSFQATDSLNYEIHVEVLTATTSAFDFLWDEIQIGPQAPYVTGLAGWKQYDISSYVSGTSWTTARAVAAPYKTLNNIWRMSFNINGDLSASAAAATISISGITSASELQALTAMNNSIYYNNGYLLGSSSTIIMKSGIATPSFSCSGDVELASQPTWAADFSNMILSETTLNTHIISRAEGNGGETITAQTEDIPFTLVSNSVGTGWDGTKFTAPEDGTYNIDGMLRITSADSGVLWATKNDAVGYQTYIFSSPTATTIKKFSGSFELKKDDTLAIRTDVGCTLLNHDNSTYLTIEKSNNASQTLAYPVNSGDGSGVGINYITNYNAELNTDDWLVGGTIPLSQETTTPIFDTASFKLTSAGTDYQGDYVSSNFTIDNAGKYNIISGEFWYRNVDLSSGDLQVRIYDVTNTAYISVSNNEIGASLAGDTAHKFTFQASDSVSYRFEIYIASASLPAFDFIYDNVIIKPQEASVTGAPVTNWEDKTAYANANLLPTGGGTLNGTYTHYYSRRVGDMQEVYFYYYSATAGSGTSAVLFPTENGINTSLLGNGRTYNVTHTNPATTGYTSVPLSLNSGAIAMSIAGGGGAVTGALCLAGAQVYMNYTYKVDGWQSNVVMSETTMNREISAKYTGNNNTSPSTSVDINFLTQAKDTTASWNGTQYTIPEDGEYEFSGLLALDAAYQMNVQIYIGGVADKIASANVSSRYPSFYVKDVFTKGDIVSFRPTVPVTLQNDSQYHYMSANKTNTGSQTIAASEKVYAVYRDSSGQVIPDNTATKITWNTKRKDTHNRLVNGVFTAPRDGIVSIKTGIAILDIDNLFTVYLAAVNTTTAEITYMLYENFNDTRAGLQQLSGSCDMLVSEGDTLEIQFFQDHVTTGAATMISNTAYNHVSFTME